MDSQLNKILDLIKKKDLVTAKKLCYQAKNQENNFHFQNTFGYLLYEFGEINEAIKKWQSTVKMNPKYFYAYSNLGNAYEKIGEFNRAVQNFNKAIQIKPDYFEAYYGLGNVKFKMSHLEDALSNLDKAIQLRPGYQPALKSKLMLLRKMSRNQEALETLNFLISDNPADADLLFTKGQLLSLLGRKNEAITSYKNTYLLDQDFPFVLGYLVEAKLANCEWENIYEEFEEIKKKLAKEEEVCPPLLISNFCDSPELQSKAAKIWSKKNNEQLKREFNFDEEKKTINIAYFSADFRDHPVSHLLTNIIEKHDRSKFKIFGFYFGSIVNKEDIYHNRIKNAFDNFYEINNLSDDRVRELCNELKIDIAIDLMVHTGGTEYRPGIFAGKCAPIQINFLGYPGTSGSNHFDYIVADKIIIPEKHKKFYSEKVIYLPNSYQPSELNRPVSDNKNFSKKDFNLPENKFIFCCFNTQKKITPEIFDTWSNILSKCNQSILWLMNIGKIAEKNLKDEIEKRNINSNRLIFADKILIKEHRARLKFADLFLDTFPYNAHTTCNDALWAGVPVLTMMGDSFPSRVAASLLNTSNLNELVTNSLKEYEQMALKVANDPKYLNELKNKIFEFKNKNPLFNSELFTNNIEKSFDLVMKRFKNNLKPDHLIIE